MGNLAQKNVSDVCSSPNPEFLFLDLQSVVLFERWIFTTAPHSPHQAAGHQAALTSSTACRSTTGFTLICTQFGALFHPSLEAPLLSPLGWRWGPEGPLTHSAGALTRPLGKPLALSALLQGHVSS